MYICIVLILPSKPMDAKESAEGYFKNQVMSCSISFALPSIPPFLH